MTTTTPTTPADCTGTWITAGRNTLTCSCCGELLVLIENDAFTYPAGTGAKAAYRAARAERAARRVA